MKIYPRKNILNVKPYVPGKPIEEARRELGLKDVIKLASNENCLGPSPKALAAIRRDLGKINRYPDSASFYLKKRLARHLGVKEDELVTGNGSDEIIVLALRAFVGSDDEVVVAKPTFLIYEIASQVQSAAIKTVPLKNELKYDLDAMRDAITDRTKIIFIANPDNPTGTYVRRDALDRFVKAVPESVIIFLDEAYFEFAKFSFKDYPNGLDYLEMPNIVVARSFSKAYGLAGLRIGYGVSNHEIISYMERVREPFNVNLLAQAAAVAALDDKGFLERTLKHVGEEKRLLYSALDDMGLRYVPSATNFVLIDVESDARKIAGILLKKGVIVRDMKAWGLDAYIRVTIGTSKENRKFIKALKEAM
jgi:histidinol-phosphate aminotransferase